MGDPQKESSAIISRQNEKRYFDEELVEQLQKHYYLIGLFRGKLSKFIKLLRSELFCLNLPILNSVIGVTVTAELIR